MNEDIELQIGDLVKNVERQFIGIVIANGEKSKLFLYGEQKTILIKTFKINNDANIWEASSHSLRWKKLG